MSPLHVHKAHRRKRYRVRLGYYCEKQKFKRNLALLIALVISHSAIFCLFEGISYFNSLYYTMTAATTTGFGDISPKTLAGKITTMSLVFSVGIYLLSSVAGSYIDLRSEIRKRKLLGTWKFKMKNKSIFFINGPKVASGVYFNRLLEQVRHSRVYSKNDIMIVNANFEGGFPDKLSNLGAVLRKENPSNLTFLKEINVKNAEIVVLLSSDIYDERSDDENFNLLHRLNDAGYKGDIISECVNEKNVDRLINAGAKAVIRPIRAYPEMIVRTMISPGAAEKIIENLFTSYDDELIRFDADVDAEWKDIQNAVTNNNIGTAIAFVDHDGKCIINPMGNELCKGKALMLFIKEGNNVAEKDISVALGKSGSNK